MAAKLVTGFNVFGLNQKTYATFFSLWNQVLIKKGQKKQNYQIARTVISVQLYEPTCAPMQGAWQSQGDTTAPMPLKQCLLFLFASILPANGTKTRSGGRARCAQRVRGALAWALAVFVLWPLRWMDWASSLMPTQGDI